MNDYYLNNLITQSDSAYGFGYEIKKIKRNRM